MRKNFLTSALLKKGLINWRQSRLFCFFCLFNNQWHQWKCSPPIQPPLMVQRNTTRIKRPTQFVQTTVQTKHSKKSSFTGQEWSIYTVQMKHQAERVEVFDHFESFLGVPGPGEVGRGGQCLVHCCLLNPGQTFLKVFSFYSTFVLSATSQLLQLGSLGRYNLV